MLLNFKVYQNHEERVFALFEFLFKHTNNTTAYLNEIFEMAEVFYIAH